MKFMIIKVKISNIIFQKIIMILCLMLMDLMLIGLVILHPESQIKFKLEKWEDGYKV